MESKLKLNGIPVWNLIDLQKAFAPLEIYDQLQEYLKFAQIHCTYLTSWLKNEEGAYQAETLTKEFWLDILGLKLWPDEANAEKCLYFFLNEQWKAAAEGIEKEETRQAIKENIYKEAEDAHLKEKLTHICVDGRLKNGHRKAILLLAICEIAEIDARKCCFTETKLPSGAADCTEKPVLLNTETYTLHNAEIKHRFLYHDEDSLRPNTQIRTVTIFAEDSNRYNWFEIALYSEKKKCCVQTIQLKAGTFRQCNVSSDGRVIKFLPDISVEEGCCIYREGSSTQNFVIKTGHHTQKLEAVGLTCFVPVGAKEGGIIVCDGKLNSDYCNLPVDDWVTITRLQAALRIVELCWVDNSLKALTDDGKIYSIMVKDNGVCRWQFGTPEKACCVSVTDATRAPCITAANKNAAQAALSGNGTQAAILTRNGECKLLLYGSFTYSPQKKCISGGNL